MQVGTTKDQSLYNKPSAAVHPGALTAGTLPQYNTIQSWLGECFYVICASFLFCPVFIPECLDKEMLLIAMDLSNTCHYNLFFYSKAKQYHCIYVSCRYRVYIKYLDRHQEGELRSFELLLCEEW